MYVKIYMYSVNYFLFYFFDYSSWLTCANSGFFFGGGAGIRGKILFVRGHHGPISKLKECDIFGEGVV